MSTKRSSAPLRPTHSGRTETPQPIHLLLLWEGEPTRTVLQAFLDDSTPIELVLTRAETDRASPARKPHREAPPVYLCRVAIRRPGGAVLYLRIAEVDWLEGANQYVRLHTGRRTFLVRESLSHLEQRLDPRQFLRIHRSTIVQLERIEQLLMESPRHRWAVLTDGTRLKVSPSSWELLQQALEATA